MTLIDVLATVGVLALLASALCILYMTAAWLEERDQDELRDTGAQDIEAQMDTNTLLWWREEVPYQAFGEGGSSSEDDRIA